MKKLEVPTQVLSGEPKVQLLAYTAHPYDLSVASARTCYYPRVLTVEESAAKPELRDAVAKLCYDSGHHTPFQHPTFVFGLENISRHFTWSFLHSHPFYNSEQTSQRYVILKEARAHVPPGLQGAQRRRFEDAVLHAWGVYDELSQILYEPMEKLMTALGRVKGQDEKQIKKDADKKSIETARYVVPVAAFTSMYHTVSGLELQRYLRMESTGDTPAETRLVVRKMVDEVKRVDPNFFDRIGDGPLAPDQILEARAPSGGDSENFVREFDQQLAGRTSRLAAWTDGAEELVADSVREVLGLARGRLSDDDAIELVLNPSKNPHLLDTLNTYTHSPLMRTLNHPSYTFKKKLSHTGDSQDQRHRTVAASRPLLTRTHTTHPDYHTPELIRRVPGAQKIYDDCMKHLWETKNELVAGGASAEEACYILPNAVNVRFTSSGALLNLHHKWRLRTCFNAQTEIYDASMDELAQAREKHPRLTRWLGPPCVIRDGRVPDHPKIGPCSEGDHWCGIKVWNNFPDVKRPF